MCKTGEKVAYLLLVVTRTPFSVEKASEGSPWMFQSLATVGLPRNVAKESGVQGIHSWRTYTASRNKSKVHKAYLCQFALFLNLTCQWMKNQPYAITHIKKQLHYKCNTTSIMSLPTHLHAWAKFAVPTHCGSERGMVQHRRQRQQPPGSLPPDTPCSPPVSEWQLRQPKQ